MKRLIFSIILIAIASTISAQSLDSIAQTHRDSLCKTELKIMRYKQRLAKRQTFYHNLIPDFARVQYAGSVGLINAGVGWQYGKHNQWETDVMFGFIPRYNTNHKKTTFTLRETYVPFRCSLTQDSNKGYFSFQPLSCGLFLNSVLSGDYWIREPSHYPNDGDYYRFSSKLRFHIFIGQRYTYHIPQEYRFMSKAISFVWELSSCDLYIVSKATNKAIPIDEILSLSLGLKFEL